MFALPHHLTFDPWVQAWGEARIGVSDTAGHQGLLLEFDQDGRAGGADLDAARRAQRLRADQMALSRPQARVRHDAVRLLHPVPVGHHSDGGDPRRARRVRQSADRPDRHVVRFRQSDRQPGDRARHLRPRLHDPVLPQLLRGVPDRTRQGGDDRRRELLPDFPPHPAAEFRADLHRDRDLPVHQHLERLPVRLDLRRRRPVADDGRAQQSRQHLDRDRRIQRQHGGGDHRRRAHARSSTSSPAAISCAA